ncbi:MAG: lipase maturation factor family protein, partial [Thermoanaerobaculia bacterium]
HQPRLDWQMWFAALGRYEDSPWLGRLEARLLEGSPPVLRLFAKNPFPDHPPRFVRAVLYDYRFTDWKTLRQTGAWWRRVEKGPFDYTPKSSGSQARPSSSGGAM